MKRNYYLVLGVPLDAAPDRIRSAFRRLAMRYHPDRGKVSDPRTFREISEAYQVLSDPRQRARYDSELTRRPRPVAFQHAAAREPEPLVSDPVSVTGRPETIRPSHDALLERFARNFVGAEPPKAEHPEPLHFALILSPEEAELGVRVPFRIPVFSPCEWCGGTGRDWLFPCTNCDGEGRFVRERTVNVDIPRGVRDRMRFDVSLDRLGVRNLWLRVHVRVARH